MAPGGSIRGWHFADERRPHEPPGVAFRYEALGSASKSFAPTSGAQYLRPPARASAETGRGAPRIPRLGPGIGRFAVGVMTGGPMRVTPPRQPQRRSDPARGGARLHLSADRTSWRAQQLHADLMRLSLARERARARRLSTIKRPSKYGDPVRGVPRRVSPHLPTRRRDPCGAQSLGPATIRRGNDPTATRDRRAIMRATTTRDTRCDCARRVQRVASPNTRQSSRGAHPRVRHDTTSTFREIASHVVTRQRAPSAIVPRSRTTRDERHSNRGNARHVVTGTRHARRSRDVAAAHDATR